MSTELAVQDLDAPTNEDNLDDGFEDREPPAIFSPIDADDHLRFYSHWQNEKGKILRAAAAQRDKLNRRYQESLAKIDAWEEIEAEKFEKKCSWHFTSLRGYLLASGKKTIKFINGTLKTRTGKASVEIIDETAFLNTADPKFISETTPQISRKPDKRAIMAHYSATSEILPFTQINTGESKFEIEIPEALPVPDMTTVSELAF